MKPSSRTLTAIAVSLFLFACGQEENLDTKKETLKQKQQELAALQADIARLQNEIAAEDTTAIDAGFIPVEVKVLAYEPFSHTIEVSGTLEAEANLSISPEASGQIRAISVKEGDRVHRGQVLAYLNTSTIESNINEIQTSLELANTLFEKQKKLWEQKIGSEMQYLEAKNRKESLESRLATLRSQLALSVIKAPVDGYVDQLYKKEGELVMPGTPLMQIVNLSQMKIVADVSETYLRAVKPGDTVKVTFPTLTDEVVYAPVYRTSNIINLKNRSFEVEVKLPNRSGNLKPNAIGTMQIVDYSNDSSLVIPSRAIGKDSNGEYVYVASSQDGKVIARKVRVTTGRSAAGMTRLLNGVTPGDSIIIKGYNEVADGNRVTIKQS